MAQHTTRFMDIEHAQETFSFIDDDISEINSLIASGEYKTAYYILNNISDDIEFAKAQFPEMLDDLGEIVSKVTPLVVKLTNAARNA